MKHFFNYFSSLITKIFSAKRLQQVEVLILTLFLLLSAISIQSASAAKDKTAVFDSPVADTHPIFPLAADTATSLPTATVTPTATPLPPATIMYITRDNNATATNAGSVSWTVKFSDQLSGLDVSNLSLINTGLGGPSITGVSPIGNSPSSDWTVTASTGTGSGKLGLNLFNDTGLSRNITTALPYVGDVYTIDRIAPWVESFERQPATSDAYTNNDTLTFRVTFSERVFQVDSGDFKVYNNNPDATTTATITNVSPVPNTFIMYDLTISGGDLANFNGTVGLDVSASNDIQDRAANALAADPPSPDETYLVDNVDPTITIERAAGQDDLTNTSPVNFTITFSEKVKTFTIGAVILNSSAPGASLTNITNVSPPNSVTDIYNVTVGNMTGEGTISVSVSADKVVDLAGNGNSAASGVDNSVFYDLAPTVTIKPAAGQISPTSGSPINFTVIFNEAVTGFVTGDIQLSGTANPTTATVTQSAPNDGTTYNVAVSGMTDDGTVIASIPAGIAIDRNGLDNQNLASTNTDNSVEYDTHRPDATIALANGYITPTNQSPIKFRITFTERVRGFATGDVTLSGTANPTIGTVTEIVHDTTYEVAVSGMTVNVGTVIVSISAGVVTDRASLPNLASNVVTVDYDAAPPSPPAILTPANGSSIGNNMPAITGTTDLDSTMVKVYLDGAFAGAATLDGNGNWSYSPTTTLGDMLHTVKATASDAVGNISQDSSINSFTVDTFSAPPIISAPVNDSFTKINTPTITGTAEVSSTISIYIDDTLANNTTKANAQSGVWTYTVPVALGDGEHNVKAIATDQVGNVSLVSSTRKFTVDTGIPNAPIISDPADNNFTKDNTPSVQGTAEAHSAITISIYDAGNLLKANGTAQADGSGIWSYVAPVLSDGQYTVTSTAADAALNVSVYSIIHTFTVDTILPDTKIETKPLPVSKDSDFTFSSTDINIDTFECALDGKPFVDCFEGDPLSKLENGSRTIAVRAKDKAGNVDNSPETYQWILKRPPPVTSNGQPSNPSFVDTQVFKFTGAAGSTFQCALDIMVFNADTDADLCSSPQPYFGLSFGPHTVWIRAIVKADSGEKTIGDPKAYTWVISDTRIVSHPEKVTYKHAATFTFYGLYLGSTTVFKCKLDGGAFGDCLSNKIYSNLSDGNHSFWVKAGKQGFNTDGKPAVIWDDATPALYTWTIKSERAVNGGYNTYSAASKIPTSWSSSPTFTALDGKDTLNKFEGTASVKVVGDGKTKTLTQTLSFAGPSGAQFIFSFYARGSALPVAGVCSAQVILYRAVGLPLTKTVSCTNGTYGFTKKTIVPFSAPWAFNKIVIKFTFNKPNGMVWFDAVSLREIE